MEHWYNDINKLKCKVIVNNWQMKIELTGCQANELKADFLILWLEICTLLEWHQLTDTVSNWLGNIAWSQDFHSRAILMLHHLMIHSDMKCLVWFAHSHDLFHTFRKKWKIEREPPPNLSSVLDYTNAKNVSHFSFGILSVQTRRHTETKPSRSLTALEFSPNALSPKAVEITLTKWASGHL